MDFSLSMLLPLLFSVFGVVFMLAAKYACSVCSISSKLAASCTVKAVGTVTRVLVERRRDNDGHYRTMYRPEYVFYDAYRSKERRCISRVYRVSRGSRHLCKIRVGDHADILYSPINERDYLIVDDMRFDAEMRRFFNIIGAVFVTIGIVATAAGFLSNTP